VYLRTGDSRQKLDEMKEVVPCRRVNCHMVPEADVLPCETTGTCELELRLAFT